MNNITTSHSHSGAIAIDNERCKGCGLCIETCPKSLIAFAGKAVNSHGYPYVMVTDNGACIGCASCGIICPDGCITVYRKRNVNAKDSHKNTK